jgi:hypothetical protein
MKVIKRRAKTGLEAYASGINNIEVIRARSVLVFS